MGERFTKKVIFDDDDDNNEIAYFTVRWKTRAVLSTAPKTWDNTDFLSLEWKSEGVMGGESGEEKGGLR